MAGMKLRAEVLGLPAYRFEAHEAAVKLDQNEAPDDVTGALRRAAFERLERQAWNRYPELHPQGLAAQLGARHDWPAEGVAVAGGSNVLIQAATIVAGLGRQVATVRPTFSVYALQAHLLGATLVERAPRARIRAPDRGARGGPAGRGGRGVRRRADGADRQPGRPRRPRTAGGGGRGPLAARRRRGLRGVRARRPRRAGPRLPPGGPAADVVEGVRARRCAARVRARAPGGRGRTAQGAPPVLRLGASGRGGRSGPRRAGRRRRARGAHGGRARTPWCRARSAAGRRGLPQRGQLPLGAGRRCGGHLPGPARPRRARASPGPPARG